MTQHTNTPMRRKEKAITNKHDLETIIRSAQVCRLAMTHDQTPYIVPMNFGYHTDTLYFHCANTGKKLNLINNNPLVCFELDINHQITNTGKPCNWSTQYTSIIGYGNATILNDDTEKNQALNTIIDHYAPGTTYEFTDKQLKSVTIIKVTITSMTGKQSKPHNKQQTGSENP